jgi:hypothetical protein
MKPTKIKNKSFTALGAGGRVFESHHPDNNRIKSEQRAVNTISLLLFFVFKRL